MSFEIYDGTHIRVPALIWWIIASGGTISTMILTSYPADSHPIAKGIALVFAVLGFVGTTAQAFTKPAIKKDVKDEENSKGIS